MLVSISADSVAFDIPADTTESRELAIKATEVYMADAARKLSTRQVRLIWQEGDERARVLDYFKGTRRVSRKAQLDRSNDSGGYSKQRYAGKHRRAGNKTDRHVEDHATRPAQSKLGT